MKRILIVSLQIIIVLIGIVILAILIRVPLTEGRATNLDWFSIYSDPFILYGYAASIAFFVGLYKVFKLLGHIGQSNLFSSNSVGELRGIRRCAIVLSVSIAMAGLYIKIFHNKEDDPVGFMAICLATTIASIVVATIAAIVEKNVRNAVDMKSASRNRSIRP